MPARYTTDMTNPQPAGITTNWPHLREVTLTRPERGTNNHVWTVTSPHGTWFLKHIRDDPRWRREYAIRAALQDAGLPFTVPRTVPTANGEQAATIGGEHYELTEKIAGRPPAYGDPVETRACGAAIGQLDAALATLDNLPINLPAVSMPFPDGDELARAFPEHPQVDDAGSTLERIERDWAVASAPLPRQLLHADPYPSNMLVENGKVRGIIDFEFCSEGHRVFELAAAIRGFALRQPGQPHALELVEALAQGYLSTLPLAVLHREALSLAHWTQRLVRGDRGRAGHQWRIDDLQAIDGWISAYADDIRQAVSS